MEARIGDTGGMETRLSPLPIDVLLPEILDALKIRGRLVLTADPGAGKTTRVPRALLDGGLLEAGDCWILEPRRLAARLAAMRVAEELGEAVGERVGYAVRFEQKTSRATRVRFVTEGLLLRRLQEDPQLKGTSTVILDEFHERHLHTDLALALLKRLQATTRPDLRILVMSATLDAAPVAAFLDAPVLHSEGRPHPVEVRHTSRTDERPLGDRVLEALDHRLPGHVLVFLPGAAEIRQVQARLEGWAQATGASVLPLHGSLSLEAQKAAVAPSDTLKVILSTNVAESSVTLDGVRTVIDSGLAREAVHSPWTGLSGLRTVRISQARILQRTGRAGRQAPGLSLRLFQEQDFRAREAFDVPELLRSDLAELVMALRGMELDPARLAWLEAPPATALEAATELLRRLGALAERGLSSTGRAMARWPLHPRLARLLVEGEALGIPDTAARAAVLLEVGDLQARRDLGARRGPHQLGDSDLWPRLDAFVEVEAAGFGAGAIRAAGLDLGAVQQARQALRSLKVAGDRRDVPSDDLLLQALLRAFPDRVARLGSSGTLKGVGGWGGRLDAASGCRSAAFIVALDAEEASKGQGALVRMASRVEPEWVMDAFPEDLEEETTLVYQKERGRVERREVLRYRDLVLDEVVRAADPADPAVADLLAEGVLAGGLEGLGEGFALLLDRAAFLGRQRPELDLPGREILARRLVAEAVQGQGSLKGLAGTDWIWTFTSAFGSEAGKLLDSWCPTHLQLPRRRAAIQYDQEQPWVASRLQDFLGMKDAPRIAGGRVPLVLHLLAPNMRAVQVTTDLPGFWQRAYQELRPALSRRYPRHDWPENPT